MYKAPSEPAPTVSRLHSSVEHRTSIVEVMASIPIVALLPHHEDHFIINSQHNVFHNYSIFITSKDGLNNYMYTYF